MPRVKLIYVGDGVWIPPEADIRTCQHPHAWLRFDSRFSMPVSCYCTLCGQPWIHPFHGLTDEEIAAAKERAQEILDSDCIDSD